MQESKLTSQTLHVRVASDTQKIQSLIGPSDIVCYEKSHFRWSDTRAVGMSLLCLIFKCYVS